MKRRKKSFICEGEAELTTLSEAEVNSLKGIIDEYLSLYNETYVVPIIKEEIKLFK